MNERTVSGTCKNCKKIVTLELPIGFNLTCDSCIGYFHSCIHCKHFDSHRNKCTSISAEPTKDPTSKNFCDEYSFSTSTIKDSTNENSNSKQKLESLFKPLGNNQDEPKPKKSINDLFKD